MKFIIFNGQLINIAHIVNVCKTVTDSIWKIIVYFQYEDGMMFEAFPDEYSMDTRWEELRLLLEC